MCSQCWGTSPCNFCRRAGTYDKQIRRWIKDDVVQADWSAEDANLAELGRRLLNKCALRHIVMQLWLLQLDTICQVLDYRSDPVRLLSCWQRCERERPLQQIYADDSSMMPTTC